MEQKYGKVVEGGERFVLIGTVTNTLDSKNRVFVPAAFRSELGSRFVITRGSDRPSLVIYTVEKWLAVSNALRSLPQSKKENRAIYRYFCECATECELDSQGRMVIPQMLKDEAGLTKEVVFIGMNDKVEIWSPENRPVQNPVDVENYLEAYDIDM